MTDLDELSDLELLDYYAKQTRTEQKDWRVPIGARDPGFLSDPNRRRGGQLTRDEKDFIYFWAKRKSVDRQEQMKASHWSECPTCKLCRCGQAHGKYVFRCVCARGMKMLGYGVYRELYPGSSKPYEIASGQ